MNWHSWLILTVRWVALVAVTLTLISISAACGRDDPPPRDPADQSSDSATSLPAATAVAGEALPAPAATPVPTPPSGAITVWHSWALRDGDALDAILKDLSGQYPTLNVDTLFVAQDDLLQSYGQAVADGSGPDVVLAPNWWLNDLRTLGAVRPLDEEMFAGATTELWTAALNNVSIDGQLYGVPTNYETVALYYNRALVQEDALPQSLDELYTAAKENPLLGIGIYANPFHVSWGFPAFGSELFSDYGHAIFDQSPGAARFLQWLADVDALEGSYVDSDYGMLVDRFKRGEFAFLVDGPWAAEDLTGALGQDLGVAAMPPGPDGPSKPWLYADAVYVNPELEADQVELAGVFIEHLTSSGSGERLASIASRLPANREADLAVNPWLPGFAAQAANAVAMPQGAHMDAFWRYGGDMILKALAGVDEMQSIVAEAAALTNDTTGK